MKKLADCIEKEVTLDRGTLHEAEACFFPKELCKGDFFLRSSHPARELAFIESGYLRLFNYAEGREVTLWIGGEGQFITGLSSFIFQTANAWNIQAETDCQLQVISRNDHFALTHKYPQWLGLDNVLLARAYVLLENSMFAHLHTTARQRYEELMRQSPAMFNHVPLQHIASMLRMTPETLSRLRHPARESS